MLHIPAAIRSWRRPLVALCAATLGAVALLAGCGGGTSQYDPFVPLRLFAFGDEMSALTKTAPAGRNYAVNGLSDNGTPTDTSDDVFDCTVFPNWVQSMAAVYRFIFAECNPGNVAEPKAQNFAAASARVADVEAQVSAAEVQSGGLRDKDIATFLVGVNDVLDLYEVYDQNPGTDESALIAQARARGERAAQLVNRLVTQGVKVIVSNIPDMGVSPFALRERAAKPDIDRAALISRLSAAFNEQLGVKIIIDGRFIALVQLDQRTQAVARSPASFLFTNATDAVCAAEPPDCRTDTLKPDAVAGTALWASERWLSSAGQSMLANLAVARALRNPF